MTTTEVLTDLKAPKPVYEVWGGEIIRNTPNGSWETIGLVLSRPAAELLWVAEALNNNNADLIADLQRREAALRQLAEAARDPSIVRSMYEAKAAGLRIAVELVEGRQGW